MNPFISFQEAVENMTFTLRTMGALKTSRSVFFGEDEFALATGTDSASENWAFFPSRNFGVEQVKRVCSFFSELSLPFVWPLFPEMAVTGQILEDAGLSARGELLVMNRQLSNDSCEKTEKNSLTFEINKNADVWAETAWRAFDSPPGAPSSFVNLARGLIDNKSCLLILAKRDGVPVGTAMRTLSDKTVGIYYFATLRSERKKGVGDAMMHEITRAASERGHNILTLQATPSGAPFYASRGFEPLFRLPLYSFSEEVF